MSCGLPSARWWKDGSAPRAKPEKLGRTAYQQNCAAGRDGAGPLLVHRIFEPNDHGDQAFFLAAENGVRQHHWRFGNMPPVEWIDDKEIDMSLPKRRLQEANGLH